MTLTDTTSTDPGPAADAAENDGPPSPDEPAAIAIMTTVLLSGSGLPIAAQHEHVDDAVALARRILAASRRAVEPGDAA